MAVQGGYEGGVGVEATRAIVSPQPGHLDFEYVVAAVSLKSSSGC